MYSSRILGDVNVLITYQNVLLTYTKRAFNLFDVSPYVGVRWKTYARVTPALQIYQNSQRTKERKQYTVKVWL